MREIKFRAWEKNLRAMISVDSINFETGLINMELVWRTFEEIELMQSTDLKDKNGVEIYEGDIVVGRLYNHGVVGWEYETKVVISDFSDIYELNNNSEEIEVIGNVFENPELLE